VRILVTGARGFIGSYLVPGLKAAGHDVLGIDRENGDLAGRDDIVGWWLDTERPDIVVHLAARTSRLISEDDPAETVRCNAVATTNVARACGERGIRLVYASTSEVYGHGLEHHKEDDLTEPTGIYGLSKLWGEHACRLYVSEDKLLVLRLSMPYGPGHAPAGFARPGRGWAATTKFLYAAYHGLPVEVHPGAERSWCWVGDTVDAVRALLEAGQRGTWNIGRDDDPRTMRSVAEMACTLMGAPLSLVREESPPFGQVVVKRLDMTKLLSTGWRPKVPFSEGMRRTAEWVRTLPSPH